jgi:hypothetical protein
LTADAGAARLSKSAGSADMVDVAQLAEHRVVVPRAAGSSPVIHPYPPAPDSLQRRFLYDRTLHLWYDNDQEIAFPRRGL